jgi:hypothetical protein
MMKVKSDLHKLQVIEREDVINTTRERRMGSASISRSQKRVDRPGFAPGRAVKLPL